MIGRSKPIVHKHWYVLLREFETSTNDFYNSIQVALDAHQLAGLECFRIEYAEGGVLSARRQYLRMRRERLIFDVCSAPFGTTWFFSSRFSEFPLSLSLLHIAALLLMVIVGLFLFLTIFGWFFGFVLYFAFLISLPLVAQAIAASRNADLDGTLLRLPLVGGIYEAFFRPETYYREDTRIAYTDIVDRIVREKIDEFTAAKGVKLVEYEDATPPSNPKILGMVGSLLGLGR